MISNQELLSSAPVLQLCLLSFALWGWISCDNQGFSKDKAPHRKAAQ